MPSHLATPKPDAGDTFAALLTALRDPAAYPPAAPPVAAVEVVETHISAVLLAGDYAYKLKKPVNLGFADFSSLALRKRYCDEEIRLNRRSAPALYLDVQPVVAGPTPGSVRIGGEGAPIDYVVRMRRFAAAARLDHVARAGRLDLATIDRLAASIADFHTHCERAPATSPHGTVEAIGGWLRRTAQSLRERVAAEPALAGESARLARVLQWSEAESTRRAPVFAARHAEGFVRDVHGDLHLANVALIDGVPVAFDCIEFNEDLRVIDVMSDVAFTWMDLLDHDLPRHAARFLNAYLEATGDYAGLATLRFYAVYRALVRALVAAIRAGQAAGVEAPRATQECARYVEAAERLTQAPAPQLVLVGGITGTGKTTVASHLVEALGAVRIRSDVERKRSAGVAATAHGDAPVGGGLYDASRSQATYALLARCATAVLDGGFIGIVDATFQRRADRGALRKCAADAHARCDVVICTAPASVLRARIEARRARGTDASDATLAVLEQQLRDFEAPAGEADVIVLDTNVDPATLAERCAGLLRR